MSSTAPNLPSETNHRSKQFIDGDGFVFMIEVDAIEYTDNPGVLVFDRTTTELLVKLRIAADRRDFEELAKHGQLFFQRSA